MDICSAVLSGLQLSVFLYAEYRSLPRLACHLIIPCGYEIYDLHWLKVVAASSMYMYVTHILVLNIARHSLAKLLTIDSDMMMCVYYIINSSICVIVCITTYFLLKRIKANRLLSVMTGGRV